jgi:hypothetical protein
MTATQERDKLRSSPDGIFTVRLRDGAPGDAGPISPSPARCRDAAPASPEFLEEI